MNDSTNPRDLKIGYGSGFISLDIIHEDGKDIFPISVGGSCGNFLTIISFLGWKAFPIVRLGQDKESQRILDYLKDSNVDTSLIIRDSIVKAPIIVEYLKSGRHRFSTNCPKCKSFFPRYTPILIKQARNYADQIKKPSVFYFDRAAPGVLELAKKAKDSGALVIFEPSSNKDNRLFEKALSICHIVKYSHDRLAEFSIKDGFTHLSVIIETRGSSGVRYRRKQPATDEWSPWEHLQSFSQKNVIDTTGSGDWLTASFIYAIFENKSNISEIDKDTFDKCINFGQAVAALNCAHIGAHGLMLSVGSESLIIKAWEAVDSGNLPDINGSKDNIRFITDFYEICSTCERDKPALPDLEILRS